jgi:hypothetical protein
MKTLESPVCPTTTNGLNSASAKAGTRLFIFPPQIKSFSISTVESVAAAAIRRVDIPTLCRIDGPPADPILPLLASTSKVNLRAAAKKASKRRGLCLDHTARGERCAFVDLRAGRRHPCKSFVKRKKSPDARYGGARKTNLFRIRSSQRSPLGGGSCLRRTRHPFAASSPEGPSQKIEFVFSASPETIRREPREFISVAQSATCGTWQPARCVIL